jgi:hypothetical protein
MADNPAGPLTTEDVSQATADQLARLTGRPNSKTAKEVAEVAKKEAEQLVKDATELVKKTIDDLELVPKLSVTFQVSHADLKRVPGAAKVGRPALTSATGATSTAGTIARGRTGVTVNGTYYPSINQAYLALGGGSKVSTQAGIKWLQKHAKTVVIDNAVSSIPASEPVATTSVFPDNNPPSELPPALKEVLEEATTAMAQEPTETPETPAQTLAEASSESGGPTTQEEAQEPATNLVDFTPTVAPTSSQPSDEIEVPEGATVGVPIGEEEADEESQPAKSKKSKNRFVRRGKV